MTFEKFVKSKYMKALSKYKRFGIVFKESDDYYIMIVRNKDYKAFTPTESDKHCLTLKSIIDKSGLKAFIDEVDASNKLDFSKVIIQVLFPINQFKF